MLREALVCLWPALREIREPWQVIVVVNGAAMQAYDALAREYPAIEWEHSDAPLGFAGAIERGLGRVRMGGTYLLNNDMTLHGDALAALLPLRSERVFAIGSQILQSDASGRREETGFTDWYVDAGGLRLFHAPAPATASRHLCVSGGASLFRTSLLASYVPASRAYDPFYWEDVEWSLRAWRDGFDVLFCPASLASHRHRATTSRFYAHESLERIVERNRALFDARHDASGAAVDAVMDRICGLPYETQRELASARVAAGVLRHRWRSRRTPQPLPPPHIVDGSRLSSSYSYRVRERRTSVRTALFVTPFAVFPPRHGGARRVAELVRGLKDTMNVALLSDEATLYDARSFADFDGLVDVRLVQRPATHTPSATLAERAQEHCHAGLVEGLRAATRDNDPDAIVIQHAELAPMVRQRTGRARWILDLHDAFCRDDFGDDAGFEAFRHDVSRYDAVTVCSPEDAALVSHPRLAIVANGAHVHGGTYIPSQGAGILFVGPFRYGPNREGIEHFLRDAWARVRQSVPEAALTILGGDECIEAARAHPLFAQAGVQVMGHRDDVPRLLAQSALAINPLVGIRGSAVKLVETLAAGRVCVTTAEGGRGFRAAAPGLVVVPDVAAMGDAVAALVRDVARRHALEQPDPVLLDTFGWHHSVARLRKLIDDC